MKVKASSEANGNSALLTERRNASSWTFSRIQSAFNISALNLLDLENEVEPLELGLSCSGTELALA
jgi:hypothetical protein